MDLDAHEVRPSRRRRKEARPAEITAAAFEVFANHGFAAAKLEDVARHAGVAKGSIYLYFPTKEELFRAVVRSAFVPQLSTVRGAAEAFDGSFAETTLRLLAGAAAVLSRRDTARFARMVIGDSRNFPDLALVWRDEVVVPMIDALTRVVARAQSKGEARQGDPRLCAFSLIGPLIAGMLYRDVFGEEASPPDLVRLAEQHADALLRGLLSGRGPEESLEVPS